jgi:hypothetical protein
MANGLRTAPSGESGSDCGIPSSHETTNAAGTAAASQANQRQRGDGSEPVGVSSRTKPAQDSQVMTTPDENPAR